MITLDLLLSTLVIVSIFVLSALGYKGFQVLKKLEVSLDKLNSITNDLESVTTSLKAPVANFSEFIMGFKNGFQVLNQFAPQLKRLLAKKISK